MNTNTTTLVVDAMTWMGNFETLLTTIIASHACIANETITKVHIIFDNIATVLLVCHSASTKKRLNKKVMRIITQCDNDITINVRNTDSDISTAINIALQVAIRQLEVFTTCQVRKFMLAEVTELEKAVQSCVNNYDN